MINPLLQAQRLGLALQAASRRHQQLLPVALAVGVTLVAALYGALLAAGAPFMVMFVAPLAVVALVMVFLMPEYAALALLGFRWGYVFDALDRSLRLQSPSLPLAVLLLVILAVQVGAKRRERPRVDPILILLLCYFMHVMLGYWYAVYPDLITARLSDFAKDILYTLVVAFWLVKPRIFEGSVWLLIVVGAMLSTLTLYQEVTQTYDNSYYEFAKVKIAQIVEGVEDKPRAGGPLGDPNYYAQMLLVIMPMAMWLAAQRHHIAARIGGGYAALMMLVAVGLSYSRGALIAVVAMLAFYFFRFKIRLSYLLYLIPLIVVAFVLAPPDLKARFSTLTEFFAASDAGDIEAIEDNSLENRSRYLIVGANMFLDSPIIGLSADHFKARFTEYVRDLGLSPGRDENRNAHNYYLEVLTEHGLIGLGLVGAMMVLAYLRLRQGQLIYEALGDHRMADLGGFLQVSFVGYAVSAIFLHGDYPRFLWLLLAVTIAFYETARTQQRAEQPAPAAGEDRPAPLPAAQA